MVFQIMNKKKIITLYNEYKKQYGETNIIDIVPKSIKEKTSKIMAYTNNAELVECIVNKRKVALYYNKKLFSCSEQYVKAVLYHEFIHISDCYNFYKLDNSNLLMNIYSEFNAMRVEFLVKCNGIIKGIDSVICDEVDNTSPRKEIEEYLDTILKISEMVKVYPNQVQNKMEMLIEMYIKSYSWMFAYLSFYEKTEKDYFKYCFERLDKYCYRLYAEELYREIQNLENIKKNPNQLLLIVANLYELCFG